MALIALCLGVPIDERFGNGVQIAREILPMSIFVGTNHHLVSSPHNRFGYRHAVGYCVPPSNTAYRKCRFRQKTGGPMNLDHCYGFADYFQALAAEASEHWATSADQQLHPEGERDTEQFCQLYLPWNSTCEAYAGENAARPLHANLTAHGLYDSACDECWSHKHSPSTGFMGRQEADTTFGSSTIIHPLNRSNWMCAWARPGLA